MNTGDSKGIWKVDWKGTAAFLFCLSVAAAAIYFTFKYALAVFLPFVIAWGLSLVIDPISSKLAHRLKLRKKPLSAFLTAILIALVFLILTWTAGRLISEAERLLKWLAADSGKLGESIAKLFDRLTSIGDKQIPLIENLMKIEQFREVWDNIDKIASEAISSAVSALTRGIPSTVIKVIGSLPSIAIFLVVTVISCFYFALDLDGIHSAILSILPRRVREALPSMKKRVWGTAARYLRAYILLLFLTFCQLFVGFSIIGVPYPLLIALLVALVDILPVLGVGSVLIPWGVIEIVFVKDVYTGIGLLILYAIVTVIRQVTEPRVVAGSLGLHPLLTIVSMYAGFKVFGLFGMILGPMAALAARAYFKKASADERS
jgi:sporulation integral membrane protein YtvI